MAHRKSAGRLVQGVPAGLSTAKSADRANAGATQHSPTQREQSARSSTTVGHARRCRRLRGLRVGHGGAAGGWPGRLRPPPDGERRSMTAKCVLTVPKGLAYAGSRRGTPGLPYLAGRVPCRLAARRRGCAGGRVRVPARPRRADRRLLHHPRLRAHLRRARRVGDAAPAAGQRGHVPVERPPARRLIVPTGQPVFAAGVLLVLALAVTGAALGGICAELDRSRWAAVAGVVLVAVNPLLVSVIGMETHLAIALVAVLAWTVLARRPYLAGVVCGLLLLTRADLAGFGVAAAVAVVLTIGFGRALALHRDRRAGVAAVVGAVVVLARLRRAGHDGDQARRRHGRPHVRQRPLLLLRGLPVRGDGVADPARGRRARAARRLAARRGPAAPRARRGRAAARGHLPAARYRPVPVVLRPGHRRADDARRGGGAAAALRTVDAGGVGGDGGGHRGLPRAPAPGR